MTIYCHPVRMWADIKACHQGVAHLFDDFAKKDRHYFMAFQLKAEKP